MSKNVERNKWRGMACDFCGTKFILFRPTMEEHYRIIKGASYKFCKPNNGAKMSQCERKMREYLKQPRKQSKKGATLPV